MDRCSWYCTEGSNQDHPQGKEMQNDWGSLTNSWEKKKKKGKGEKERYTHLNSEFQRIAMRDKKAFPQWSMQRNREKW